VADHGDTLPLPVLLPAHDEEGVRGPAVHLYGLHLSANADSAGALLVFAAGDGGARLHADVVAALAPDDRPAPAQALAQLRRLMGSGADTGLAARQSAGLAAVWEGLQAAAGLPLLSLPDWGPLAQGVLVRVPDECDEATFYSYVRAENTPVLWLPELRPLHPDARCQHSAQTLATGERLARWLLVPVGPVMSEEEVRHAVLGIVKAADYLGVRWYSDPRRAAWYATMLDERYGPGHDAYRPAFALEPGHLAAPRPAGMASPSPRPGEGATCGLAIP
jgi:hypothetical protein